MQIRPMAPADLDRVIEIERSLEQAPHWARSAWLSALDPTATPSRLALVAEDPSSHAIAAFAVASLLPPQAELEMIAVAPEAQRRGLARHLFTELTMALRAQQVTEVSLEVRASNHPALALYHQLGFVETARRPRYYADPVEDAFLLSLRLP
jgi:ribosomal-protein-alanine N-acetyltransferase